MDLRQEILLALLKHEQGLNIQGGELLRAELSAEKICAYLPLLTYTPVSVQGVLQKMVDEGELLCSTLTRTHRYRFTQTGKEEALALSIKKIRSYSRRDNLQSQLLGPRS